MDTYTRQIVVNAHHRDRQAEAREARLARIATAHAAGAKPATRAARPPVIVLRGHVRPLALGFLLSFGVLVGAVAANSDTSSGAPQGGSGGGGPAAAQPQ